MRNLSVHWHEGLFIRPHHFQAADRHWTELVQTSQQWDHPYHYGLQKFEFSHEALANSQLQVHVLHARMRDGTLVALDAGQEPDRLDVRQAFADLKRSVVDLTEALRQDTVIRVYLGIPKLKMGRTNVSDGEVSGDARFVESRISLQDESYGGNDQEILLKNLNARLLLSTEDLSGYDLLPIAQIKRVGEGESAPQLDETYIPPVVAIDAWPGLGRDMVRAANDIIGQKIDVLSRQIVNRDIGLDSRHPGDLDRVLMLSQLNAASAALGVLAFAQGVHPLVAYTELCRAVGQLSIFDPGRRVLELPAYDHEDLHRIFSLVRQRLEELIYSVRDFQFQQRYFAGVGLGMQVSLEPRWFNSDWQWLIGVKKGDLTAHELRELLSPGQLDWKLGSARQVEILFKRRAEGVQLVPADRTIRALPTGEDWTYYDVPRTDSPAWRDVQETETLAMRLKDSLIVNLDRLQGERQLVVRAGGRQVTLEFALFAVPVRS